MAEQDTPMPSFDNGLNISPQGQINNPTFTLPDFTLPSLQRVDLTAPGGDMRASLSDEPVINSHLDTMVTDPGVSPVDCLNSSDQAAARPDTVTQSHIDTHVFDAGVPPLVVMPDLVPDYPLTAQAIEGPIQAQVSEAPGQFYGNPGPDGDGDDDDVKMPPYEATNSTPGMTHRERHLDPLYEGLKGQVDIGPAPGDKGLDMTPVMSNTPPLAQPEQARRARLAWQA